jgi:hypothetical protein
LYLYYKNLPHKNISYWRYFAIVCSVDPRRYYCAGLARRKYAGHHSNPQEKLDQVILPFFTTKPDGNGIGLALSKHILYHQKGTISIESTPEKGTSVILEILFQK